MAMFIVVDGNPNSHHYGNECESLITSKKENSIIRVVTCCMKWTGCLLCAIFISSLLFFVVYAIIRIESHI